MFLFAVSSFTSRGVEHNSSYIRFGEYSMFFWMPSIIFGMLFGGIGLFFTIKNNNQKFNL